VTPASRRPIDVALEGFVAAWHAGAAPSVAGVLAATAPADRDELQQLLGAFLQIAPTVEPTAARAAELTADPLVEQLVALEEAGPFGERLHALREAAGVSIETLAEGFANAFSLPTVDRARAPHELAELELGALPPAGVADRARRAIERLLGSSDGALGVGPDKLPGAPAATAEPDGGGDRPALAELLRDVDQALSVDERDPSAGPRETLDGLLRGS